VVALVVDQAAAVPAADPRGHGREVGAGPGLVGQRPRDHARMILVPLHRARRPVQVRLPPGRVVAGVAAPGLQSEPVRLQVALVDHPQPVGVAQIEEARVGRVVAGPHRVDVVPLHGQHISQHRLRRQRPAGTRVPFVPVDAAQHDRRTVDGEHPAARGGPPEADPDRDALVIGHDLPGVQPRPLVGPRLDTLDHVRSRRVGIGQAQFGHDEPGRARGLHRQRAPPAGRVEVRVHEEVLQPARRDPHRAEDPGQPPHVLVFQVAARGPLVDTYGQHIPAGTQHPGDVELGWQAAALAVAEPHPVEPCRETGIHTLEPQRGARQRKAVRDLEPPPVLAGRVGVRNPRRVDRERVRHVGVRGCAVPGQLPARRHHQFGPSRVVELRPLEPRGHVGQAGREPEPPPSVQVNDRQARGEPCPRPQTTPPRAAVLNVGEFRRHQAILSSRTLVG
jgi:hypothetical protein